MIFYLKESQHSIVSVEGQPKRWFDLFDNDVITVAAEVLLDPLQLESYSLHVDPEGVQLVAGLFSEKVDQLINFMSSS